MAMPSQFVDAIFEKLALTYGRSFLDRWIGLDIDAVKADWARELAGLERTPAAIAHALKSLDPEKPPTVLVFRAAVLRAPEPYLPRLPSPMPRPNVYQPHLNHAWQLCGRPDRVRPVPPDDEGLSSAA